MKNSKKTICYSIIFTCKLRNSDLMPNCKLFKSKDEIGSARYTHNLHATSNKICVAATLFREETDENRSEKTRLLFRKSCANGSIK